MSKPVILAVDDPGARYLLLTARVAAAAGEGAMSVCFLHRYLAAI